MSLSGRPRTGSPGRGFSDSTTSEDITIPVGAIVTVGSQEGLTSTAGDTV